LIAVFGLMPVGVQANRNATSQTATTNIIAAVIADLRATPKNSTTSSQFSISFGTNRCVCCSQPPLYFDSQGEASCDLGGSLMSNCSSSWSPPLQTRYQLNITWTGSPGLRYADVKVTWPAAASLANASGSVEVFAAFDRN
jgi:hypothetical protein